MIQLNLSIYYKI